MKTAFTAVLAAVLLPLAILAAETQTVLIVNGFGDSKSTAEKDALRAAVRKVVGELVDAETFVENDEIISEKILTASNGFVSSYEIVEGPFRRKDGTIRVKIRATVEREKLEPKVRAATSSATAVSGDGLFAELLTRQESIAGTGELLQHLFEDVPGSLLVAGLCTTDSGKPAVRLDAVSGAVSADVEIRVDWDAYDSFVSELEKILGKIALSKKEIRCPHNGYRRGEIGRGGCGTTSFSADGSSYFVCIHKFPSRPELTKDSYAEGPEVRYGLDRDHAVALLEAVGTVKWEFSCLATLRLRDGTALVTKTIASFDKPAYSPSTPKNWILLPYGNALFVLPSLWEDWMTSATLRGNRIRVQVSFGRFPPEQLKEVESIDCSFQPCCE